MKSAADILSGFRILTTSTEEGRYYTTCPQCSHRRQKAHQKLKCLGVTIGAEGVMFGCNHCGWKGGDRYERKDPRSDGHRIFREPRNIARSGRAVRDLYR